MSINQLRFRQPAVIKLYDLITSIEYENSNNINSEKSQKNNEKTFQSIELKKLNINLKKIKHIYQQTLKLIGATK